MPAGSILLDIESSRTRVENPYQAALAWWGRKEADRIAAAIMVSLSATPSWDYDGDLRRHVQRS